MFILFWLSANVSKQMMQKNLLAKYRRHGSCKNGMEPVTTNVTAKTRDDLIYTLEEGEYELYKVVEY